MMKKLVFTFLLIATVACNRSNFTLDLSIKEGCDFNGRQVYLLVYYDNVAQFVDSMIIDNNHAKLSVKLPFDEQLCEIIIEDVPVSFQQFRFSPKETVSFVFDPDYQTLYPPVKGSIASEEIAEYWIEVRQCFDRMRSVRRESLAIDREYPKYEVLHTQLSDIAIEVTALHVKLFNETKSLINAYSAYSMLSGELPADSLARMKDTMLKRWSNSASLSLITNCSIITGDSIGDYSASTKAVLNRKAVLMGDPLPYPSTINSETTKHEPYYLGNQVKNIDIQGLQGYVSSLYSLTTPYILVDFWASWCAPCREETPHLKRALADNPDQLSIYAVSIDSNLNSWKAAIEKDESQAFTHTILRRDNPQYDALSEQFGLQQIPRNYLLDKDRRIIAIDLRGEELSKKMRELTGR